MADDWELPVLAGESERVLAESLGPTRLRSIDDALTSATQPRWLKVARVVSDAMKAGDYQTDDAPFDLHVRRVIALVELVLRRRGTFGGRGTVR